MTQRAGGDRRGSNKDRSDRKVWMISPIAGFGGDGTKVPCSHCGCMLDYDTVEADRKEEGGSYRHSNIQPSCRSCNVRRNRRDWVCEHCVRVAAEMAQGELITTVHVWDTADRVALRRVVHIAFVVTMKTLITWRSDDETSLRG